MPSRASKAILATIDKSVNRYMRELMNINTRNREAQKPAAKRLNLPGHIIQGMNVTVLQ